MPNNRIDTFSDAMIKIFDELRYASTPRCEMKDCENSPTHMWRGLMVCDSHDFVLMGFADHMDGNLGRGTDA